jgi:hypothetical protein
MMQILESSEADLPPGSSASYPKRLEKRKPLMKLGRRKDPADSG